MDLKFVSDILYTEVNLQKQNVKRVSEKQGKKKEGIFIKRFHCLVMSFPQRSTDKYPEARNFY